MTSSAEELRLDDQLCFAAYAATNAIVRAYRPLLHDLGLTYPQYLVLMALWEADDVSTSELAGRLQLPVHGVMPILERLQHADLVLRHRDTEDRRVVRVTLTVAGRELEPVAARAAHEVVCRTAMTRGDLEALREQLHDLTAVLSDGRGSAAGAAVRTPSTGESSPE